MKIGFYLTGAAPAWMGLFLDSCRQYMRAVPVVQFTDETTAAVAGVDDVQRLPAAPLALHRARHFAALSGDWLLLDSDVVVQRDVSDVFELAPFDVALTDRFWSCTTTGALRVGGELEFIRQQFFNVGVIFSRGNIFWIGVLEHLQRHPELQTSWFGDQIAVGQVARSGWHRVLVLSGQIYNFPPETADDPDIAQAALVHYKGKQRKPFLLARSKQVAA